MYYRRSCCFCYCGKTRRAHEKLSHHTKHSMRFSLAYFIPMHCISTYYSFIRAENDHLIPDLRFSNLNTIPRTKAIINFSLKLPPHENCKQKALFHVFAFVWFLSRYLSIKQSIRYSIIMYKKCWTIYLKKWNEKKQSLWKEIPDLDTWDSQ